MKMRPIETERLLLRPYVIGDAPAVHAFQSDAAVTRYTHDGGPKSLEEIEKILRHIIFTGDYVKHGYGRMAVIHRNTQKLIGFSGLKYLSDRDEVDIGHRFSPEFWGQGIATEAGFAVMEFGWRELKLRRIIGMAVPENVASIRVLEKFGYEIRRHGS